MSDIDALIERLKMGTNEPRSLERMDLDLEAADALAKLQEINVTQADRMDAEIARLQGEIGELWLENEKLRNDLLESIPERPGL